MEHVLYPEVRWLVREDCSMSDAMVSVVSFLPIVLLSEIVTQVKLLEYLLHLINSVSCLVWQITFLASSQLFFQVLIRWSDIQDLLDFVYFCVFAQACCQKWAFPKFIWLAIALVEIKQVLKNVLYWSVNMWET